MAGGAQSWLGSGSKLNFMKLEKVKSSFSKFWVLHAVLVKQWWPHSLCNAPRQPAHEPQDLRR
jgi:hypothetical protein